MAAINTGHFGNGELVMGNGLAVDNYQLPITDYLSSFANVIKQKH